MKLPVEEEEEEEAAREQSEERDTSTKRYFPYCSRAGLNNYDCTTTTCYYYDSVARLLAF